MSLCITAIRVGPGKQEHSASSTRRPSRTCRLLVRLSATAGVNRNSSPIIRYPAARLQADPNGQTRWEICGLTDTRTSRWGAISGKKRAQLPPESNSWRLCLRAAAVAAWTRRPAPAASVTGETWSWASTQTKQSNTMQTIRLFKRALAHIRTRITMLSCLATLVVAALALIALSPAVIAQGVDRRDETNPNWPPSATMNTETVYPKRVGLGRTPFRPTTLNEVSHAPNPRDAATRIDATNRKTTPHDLDAYRKDGQPGVGYSRLSPDPRDAAADRTGRTLVEQALDGQFLNNDPRSLVYLANSARAMKLSSLTRNWEWAFGSDRFIRICGSGSLVASVGAGTSSHTFTTKVVGTFFRRTRELGNASLRSIAPASPSAVRNANLTVRVLGRSIVDETVSDTKPFVKPLKRWHLAPQREWWSGSISVPWIGMAMAFKMTSDPVTVTPRVAIGNASAAGEVALRSGLETLGEVPLASLWGFASILARIHFRPVDGQLIGGESVGLVWDGAGRPLLRDARYARTEISYGAVNLKVKAQWGFKVFGWTLWDEDKTLWSVFKHDGHRSSREVLSYVRQVALR